MAFSGQANGAAILLPFLQLLLLHLLLPLFSYPPLLLLLSFLHPPLPPPSPLILLFFLFCFFMLCRCIANTISRLDMSCAQAPWIGSKPIRRVMQLKLHKPTMAIGYPLRMCARHVYSTNPGRSNLVFRPKPIAEVY